MARPKKVIEETPTPSWGDTLNSVIAPVVDDAIEAAPAPSGNVFTNTAKATTIHLGDGRKLAPGESAEVSPALMAILTGAA